MFCLARLLSASADRSSRTSVAIALGGDSRLILKEKPSRQYCRRILASHQPWQVARCVSVAEATRRSMPYSHQRVSPSRMGRKNWHVWFFKTNPEKNKTTMSCLCYYPCSFQILHKLLLQVSVGILGFLHSPPICFEHVLRAKFESVLREYVFKSKVRIQYCLLASLSPCGKSFS